MSADMQDVDAYLSRLGRVPAVVGTFTRSRWRSGITSTSPRRPSRRAPAAGE